MAYPYLTSMNTRHTPQTQAIPGREADMVPNSAGGVTFSVDMWTQLDRFLILGSEGGSYYASQQKLTAENAKNVISCIKKDGPRAVNTIVAVSDAGRAPKNDPAIFALALAASFGDEKTKQQAFAALPKVCRIGTHLFHFAATVDGLRGWGRGLRRAVANWYESKDPKSLAYQVTKYQQRDGWSHRDLLRLSHPEMTSEEGKAVARWVTHGNDLGPLTVKRKTPSGRMKEVMYPAIHAGYPAIITAMEMAKKATSAKEIVRLIRNFNLVRECIPTQFLNEASVWEALLENMPVTALIRNLGNLTKHGVIAPLSNGACKAIETIGNVDALKKGRVHPLAILMAMKQYAVGRGLKGSSTWSPVKQVVEALDEAFYSAFQAVEPTGKRWFLGLDVSGSMSAAVAGSTLSCCEGATALALVTAKTEKQTFIGRFNNGIEECPFGHTSRLNDALAYTRSINCGGTDCSLPMVYALQHKIPVDVFAVYTDSETYAGRMQPVQALREYRQKMGIDAKLIVVGMTSNGFTLADPTDAGMLDVVGFDTTVPAVMANFARGTSAAEKYTPADEGDWSNDE